MTSFAEQLHSYAAYHHDWRNKLTHLFGVPLVTFAIFIPMGWFRIHHFPEVPLLSGAAVFYLCVLVYYLRLDWVIALVQMPASLALLWAADLVALLPFVDSLLVFLGAFVLGWMIQLVGHVFEGQRPALTDNLLQIFNAPLFLTVEVLMLFGFYAHPISPKHDEVAAAKEREAPALTELR